MKNKKTKYYLKNNLIGLIVGGIIFGSLGVYAAITFPSNEVSFDPSNSTLSSTNVKDAIDELYTKCTKEPTASDQIIEDAGLEKDPYECRYFFTGANPNNYITFNNEKAGWRIISVECDGTIKIMRNTSVEPHYWDESGSYGNNNWARPASLNTYLNGTYYNELTSTAQSQIISKDWSIGAVTYDNNDLKSQINDENGKKWKGKIALPTVSEYLRTNSNTNVCKTLHLNNWNYSTCTNTTWLFNGEAFWMITALAGNSENAFFLDSDVGLIDYYGVSYTGSVCPSLYLNQNIKITGGTGSKTNPYTIE